MVLEVTIDRLSNARTRVEKHIDANILNWTVSVALPIVKARAFAQGLSQSAVDSIKVEKIGFMSCSIFWDLKTRDGKPLAKFLEDGTQGHDIEARFTNFLKFEIDGTTLFRRKVRHPGTAAMNIFKSSKQNAQSIMKTEIAKRVTQFLDSTRVQ